MVLNRLYLCLLVILISFTSGCNSASKDDPKKVLEQYYSNIKKDNYEGSYDLLADSTKKKVNKETFGLYCETLREFCELKNYTIENIDKKGLDLQERKYVQFFVIETIKYYRDGTESKNNKKKSVVNEEGVWKINLEDTNFNKFIAYNYAEIGWMYHDGDGGKKQDLYKSAEYFHKAIKIDPNFFRGYYGLGIVYIDLGRYEEAIQQLNVCLTKTQDKEIQSGTYNVLGLSYFNKGDQEKAKVAYLKAIELDPTNEYARSNLSKLPQVQPEPSR